MWWIFALVYASETLVCGRDYALELDVTSDDCSQPLPKAIATGSRPKAGGGLFKACGLHWFSSAEACDLVGSVGRLFFDGDSLIRQLLVGLTAILSGNLRTGGINAYAPPGLVPHCECEHQWQCYRAPVNHRLSILAPQYTICPRWTRDHLVFNTVDDVDLQKHLSDAGQLLVVSNAKALHRQLNDTLATHLLQRTLDVLARSNANASNARSTLVPMTVHWPGPNKPKRYRKKQGEAAVQKYNQALRKWADDRGLWLLETYAFTYGEYSRDGVHYDDLNIALAQVFLNYVAHLQLHGIIDKSHEHSPRDNTTYTTGDPTQAGFPVYKGPHDRTEFHRRHLRRRHATKRT